MYTVSAMFRTLFVRKTDAAHVQLFRSILSSNISFALDFLLLLFLVEVCGLYYIIASVMSFIAGASLSYILSVLWIFNKRAIADKRLEFFLFLAVGGVGVGLNSLFLYIFTEFVGLHYLLSKIVSASLVFFFNFFSRKVILFR